MHSNQSIWFELQIGNTKTQNCHQTTTESQCLSTNDKHKLNDYRWLTVLQSKIRKQNVKCDRRLKSIARWYSFLFPLLYMCDCECADKIIADHFSFLRLHFICTWKQTLNILTTTTIFWYCCFMSFCVVLYCFYVFIFVKFSFFSNWPTFGFTLKVEFKRCFDNWKLMVDMLITHRIAP